MQDVSELSNRLIFYWTQFVTQSKQLCSKSFLLPDIRVTLFSLFLYHSNWQGSKHTTLANVRIAITLFGSLPNSCIWTWNVFPWISGFCLFHFSFSFFFPFFFFFFFWGGGVGGRGGWGEEGKWPKLLQKEKFLKIVFADFTKKFCIYLCWNCFNLFLCINIVIFIYSQRTLHFLVFTII